MTLEAIRKIVEQYTQVNDLSEHTRLQPVPFARWLYFYMCRRYTLRSLSDIGKHIGYDHATVIYGLKILENEMSTGQFHFKQQFHEINDYIARYLGEKEYISIEHSNEYFELWKKIAS